MPNPRLKFALEQIPSSDWEFFERFAAEFLVEDYPELRTTASQHGDKGRDGEVFEVGSLPDHMVQYSLASDWTDKIRKTVVRLSGTKPEMKVLIYATARKVGADADNLKKELRAKGITLDVLDQSYFLERELTTGQRRAASEEIVERIVEPLLREREVARRVALPLASEDARVAVLHLALDARDEATDKNLTRSSFESLALAALHNTSAEQTMALDAIVTKILSYLPAAEKAQQVRGQTEAALVRLARKRGPIKHIRETDSYHLSFEYQKDLAERSSDFLSRQLATGSELVALLGPDAVIGLDDEQIVALASSLRVALESLLLKRGEQFVESLRTGEIADPSETELADVLTAVENDTGRSLPDKVVAYAIASVLKSPPESILTYLQSLADAYTMFAFLRQTPEVQKVANQLFMDGEIWLDTTMILPLLAETAEYDQARQPYTTVIKAAQASGIQFFVTEGVIEEVETHIYNSRTYALGTPDPWRGRVPFLFTSYITSGLPRDEFASWVEDFRSDQRPQEDVEEFLTDVFSIRRRDLTDAASAADQALRSAVQELWARAHDERRAHARSEMDISTMLRLVAHDVENCVGVIVTRKESPDSPLGYRHWWLTLDRKAYGLDAALREALGRGAPHSPAMDPAFLIRVLRMSRSRSKVSSDLRAHLPLLLEMPFRLHKPEELIRIAEQVRAENAGRSERVIRHAIRDRMDELRTLKRPPASDVEQPATIIDLVTDELDL